jgi:hypothetical protein
MWKCMSFEKVYIQLSFSGEYDVLVLDGTEGYSSSRGLMIN